MNTSQLKKEFLTPQLMLKLHGELESESVHVKIRLIREYAEEVRQTYDQDVFQVHLNYQLGFYYAQDEAYDHAVSHLLRVLDVLKPTDFPSLYFRVVGLVVRSYRLLQEYERGDQWVDLAFANIHHLESPFETLDLLFEYVDFLKDSGADFDTDRIPFVDKVINEMGFQINRAKPVEDIEKMRELNKKWNKRLMEITLMNDRNERIKAFENYVEVCEIGWYRQYVEDMLANDRSDV